MPDLGAALSLLCPDGGWEVSFDPNADEAPQISRWDRPEPQPTVEEIATAAQAALRAKTLASLANRRWRAEVGGITVSDLPIATDRESQGKLLAAYVAVKNGVRPDPSVWKCADGIGRPISNAHMEVVCLSVMAHVQACFDHEAELAEQIRTGGDPDIEAGWPA